MQYVLQHAGIDVSAKSLNVCLQPRPGHREHLVFSNDEKGHQQLRGRLSKGKRRARVALEASGLYSLDLALALEAEENIEVMVLNPARAHSYAQSCARRSKTDSVDAEVLLDFVLERPFQPWQRPAPERLQLRTLIRRLKDLIALATQEKNRRHAAEASEPIAQVVEQSLEQVISYLEEQVLLIEAQALELVKSSPALEEDFRLLVSTPGIATRSALLILGEIGLLPADMDAKKWVAHAGLDPCHHQSGSSVHKPSRISRKGNPHLRAALYMPALVACKRDPHVKTFYKQLLARGKKPIQAVVAVMRKLLHAIYGMLKHRTPFDGAKFRTLQLDLNP